MKARTTFFVLSVLLGLTFQACKDNQDKHSEQLSLVEKDTASFTQVRFTDSIQSFGSIKKGEIAKLKYTVENIGQYPLYIISVQPSCGCTVAEYTKGAILPGKSGIITASFDSNHGSAGEIHKSIIVTTNSKNNPNFVVAFNGTVTE